MRLEGIPLPFPSFVTTLDFLYLGYPLSRIFPCLEQKLQSLEYLCGLKLLFSLYLEQSQS